MKTQLNFIKLTTLFLFLEIICAFWGGYLTSIGNENLLIIIRTLEHVFLFLYYFIAINKKVNINISAFIFIALCIGIISIFDIFNIFLIGLLALNRLVLIFYNKKEINIKTIKKTYIFLLIFIILLMFILFSLQYLEDRKKLYQNDQISLLLLVSGILMLIILMISISRLTTKLNKSNILFFTAISLFIIADAIFLTMDFGISNTYSIAINDIFYSISLFLIIQSDIEKEKTFIS